MRDLTRVAVDAMGGDNAPQEIVKGAVDAVKERESIQVSLCGRQEALEAELDKYEYPKDRISLIGCDSVIEMSESPVNAIRSKKDSSMVVALNMVRKGEADAMVSAGNSGAVLVGGQTIVGRIRGIERPALAPLLPTEKGVSLLIDCGANVDARASHLLQFAEMGSIYMEQVMGIQNPSVGIVNIGAEEEKGNALVKETYPLLKARTDINFIGSVEARDIPAGACDVIVCEAFVGNVILKLYEGLGKSLFHIVRDNMMETTRTKIGAALAMPALRKTMKTFSASDYGGAPLLGLKGLVVKSHGSSDAKEVMNSIFQCEEFKEKRINELIRENLTLHEDQ